MDAQTRAQECAPVRPAFADLLRATARDVRRIAPMFFAAIVFSTLLEMYVPQDLVHNVLGKNPLVAIPVATITGVILPVPRYATYPIALALLAKGATLPVVYALIGGEVILGSLERDVLEVRYFGWRSYLLRLVLVSVGIILTGYAMEVFF